MNTNFSPTIEDKAPALLPLLPHAPQQDDVFLKIHSLSFSLLTSRGVSRWPRSDPPSSSPAGREHNPGGSDQVWQALPCCQSFPESLPWSLRYNQIHKIGQTFLLIAVSSPCYLLLSEVGVPIYLPCD